MQDLVFVGIRGHLVALDRVTGSERWRTKLKGVECVLFNVDGPAIYATVGGEAYCVDAATGAVLWHNKLKGLGYGLAAIGTVQASPEQVAAMAVIRKRQAAAAAATTAAT